jgi:transposase
VGDQELATLKMWSGAGTSQQRMADRARVVLNAAEGLPLDEIAHRTGLSRQSCLKWRKRFVTHRLDGLKDQPRSGRPAVIGPDRKLEVMALATTRPPEGSSRWSVRKLAKRTGMSKATVCRILRQASLKPHKTQYWCGRSPDPEFAEKQAAILRLYLDPPENALVLSVDEKSQIQALDRTQPELPLKPGKPRRQTHTYTRHGTTCLLAALVVHEGSIQARCVDRHTHREFLAFLAHLYRKHPYRHLHVILDNLSAHKHRAVIDWAARRRRLTLHFTPTYASWLNQVEIWFSIFARDVIRGGIWRSKKQLVDQILYYVQRYNEQRAKPFAWTYTGKPLAA